MLDGEDFLSSMTATMRTQQAISYQFATPAHGPVEIAWPLHVPHLIQCQIGLSIVEI